jgi:Predicted N-acetylglucosamine kinase
MLDGRLPPSILLREIMKDLNFNEIDEIVEWAYKNPNVSEIASLAKAVDRAASKGDGIAKDIIANSAMELVEACKTVSMRAGVNEVGYTGGVFKSALFREKFVSFARERGLNALMLRRKPEIGAIAIGLKELNYSIELVDRLMM